MWYIRTSDHFSAHSFRWVKAFKAGKFSVDTRPGRPKTSVTKANIAAVKIVVEQDARLSVKDTARCTGISEGSVQTILKKRLDLRKVCAWWVPHLLTEEQKTQRLKCARELSKTYKGCNSRVISNLLTGDETWVHMFEPQRRADNKQWKRKDQKRPCIAERTICSKTQFSLIQVGQSFKCLVHLIIQSLADSTIILYWKKWKSFTIWNDQANDSQESTFYMTTPPLISVRLLVFFGFWKGESFKPSTLLTWPCDFFLFPRLKKMPSGNKYTSRSSLGSAIYQCLQQKKTIHLLFATG